MRRGRPEPQNRSGKPLGTPGVSGELRGSEEGECCGEMMALERGKAERTEREPRPEGRRPGFRFGLGRGLAGRPEGRSFRDLRDFFQYSQKLPAPW